MLSRVTQNVFVFRNYLCPRKSLLSPYDPAPQPEWDTEVGGREEGCCLGLFFKLDPGSREPSLSWKHLQKVEAPLWRRLLQVVEYFFWACNSSHSEKVYFTSENCFGVNFANPISTMELELVPGARSVPTGQF